MEHLREPAPSVIGSGSTLVRRQGEHMPAGRWDLQGDLSTFSATDILQLLGLARSTGILTVRRAGGRDAEEVMLCLVSGKPVYGYSRDLPSPLDGLVMAGWQGEGLWDRVVRMVRQGRVDKGALAQALDRRVEEVVRRMLKWRQGEFTFLARRLAPEMLVESDVSLESLILDLVRRADEAGEEVR